MQNEDVTGLIESIADGQQASVVVYDQTGVEKKLECTYKESEAPFFFLLFQTGVLPANLDLSRKCIFTSLNSAGSLITIGASIIEFSNNRILELEASNTFRPEDLRDFFRVDLRVPAKISYEIQAHNQDTVVRQCAGETIDISQSGVLVMLPEECPKKKTFEIQLHLPNPNKTVTITGRMVRKHRVKNNRWLTSFQFENVGQIERDAIAMNCFAVQRRQLRENVKTAS